MLVNLTAAANTPLGNAIPLPLSHVLFGILGGVLFCVMWTTRHGKMRPMTWALHIICGGIAADVITNEFGLPNHFTSLFVGYFGVDVVRTFIGKASDYMKREGVLPSTETPDGDAGSAPNSATAQPVTPPQDSPPKG